MKEKFSPNLILSENAIIFYLFAAKILFHLLHPEYGYHRDELYYITISDHFSFQNLDMLPLTPLYLKLITAVFGYSIKALHFASGLLGAFSLLFSCLIARELGAKKYAILLTGIFTLFSGFMIFGAIFTYDSLDFLIQVVAIYLLVKMIKYDNPKLWILIGVVLGLGLLNKLTILFFGLAIFVCLWLVPQRKYFKTKWIWLAGVIALFFSIPFAIWQSQNGWYFVNFAADYSGGLAYNHSLPIFLWNQILPNNIFLLPVWLLGLGLLLFSSKWKQYRLFGYMYVFLFFLHFMIGAKFYFLIPMYSILIATSAVNLEGLLKGQKPRRLLARLAIPILYVLFSIPILPMIVPILPMDQLIEYLAVVGVDAGVRTANHRLNQLPQHIADRFGWEVLAQQVADIYDAQAPALNGDVGIITNNWGQASALSFFGQKYDLPMPITMHGWYYFETRRKHEFNQNYIAVGISEFDLRSVFAEVIPMEIYTNPYCMPYENNKPIFLCEEPKYNLKKYWIVARNPDPRFLAILQNEGVDAAIAYYHQQKDADPSILLFTERQINSLGYDFLNKGKIEDAILLFEFNVELFPQSANVYDSLGEAFMVNGQYEFSVMNYKKSLELNPKNSNAVEKMKEIEKIRCCPE